MYARIIKQDTGQKNKKVLTLWYCSAAGDRGKLFVL